ncbi:MAG: NAD-dependent epimerase/dehydratase family protein [bacterium]
MLTEARVSFERILIVGCGYTGSRLAKLAEDAGIEVVATKRQWEAEQPFQTVAWDVAAGDSLATWMNPRTVVVWSVPTLPNLGDHLAPLRATLADAVRERVAGFVYVSSTSVYGNQDGRQVDESSSCQPSSPAGVMRLESENLVRTSAPRGVVVRPAGIYGPGRDLAMLIESGRYEVVNPDKITNRIHVHDLASALLFAAVHGSAGAVFNAADGNPARVGDVVDFLVERYGLTPPPSTTLEEYRRRKGEDAAARWTNEYAIVPAALVAGGFTFAYPDIFTAYRTGSIR